MVMMMMMMMMMMMRGLDRKVVGVHFIQKFGDCVA